MSFELCWERKGAVIRFSGVVSGRDALDATTAYEADIRFDSLRFVIADYTAISACKAVPRDIEMVAAMDFGSRQTNARIRKAVVTTSAEVKAMAQHYQSNLESPMPVAVFATMQDARAWLGLD